MNLPQHLVKLASEQIEYDSLYNKTEELRTRIDKHLEQRQYFDAVLLFQEIDTNMLTITSHQSKLVTAMLTHFLPIGTSKHRAV